MNYALAALLFVSFFGASSRAAGSGPDTARLDEPLTAQNSSVIFLGDKKLRVPKEIAGSGPSDTGVRVEEVSFVFEFPTMRYTSWPALIDTIFSKQRGTYAPQIDRFPVRIISMFYSQADSGPWERRPELTVPYARPGRLLINQELQNNHMKPLTADREVSYSDSTYPGLRLVHWPIPVPLLSEPQASERAKKHEPGQHYVSTAESPYELYMLCDPPSGLTCAGYMLSKGSLIEYRFEFPLEAVRHSDELFRILVRLSDTWSQTTY